MKNIMKVLLVMLLGTLAVAKSMPVPTVDQPLVPDAAKPGASAFTLTLQGSGFVTGSTVQWNGKSLKTKVVSKTKLSAKVPASYVSKAGTASVVVENPGRRTSNVSYFQIIKPEKSVAFQFSTAGTGAEPYAVATGDFNGDGKVDLAVPNVSATTVSILLGNGDGTFQTEAEYQAGYAPIGVAVGDLNGDGILDLVVVNNGNKSNGHPGTVTILIGNGDGSFTTGKSFNTGNGPLYAVLGDFNRDGKLDVAVSDYNVSFGNSVAVLLGKGDGTLRKYVTYGTGSAPEELIAADVNGDGILDLVTANEVGNSVSVLLGKADGTFQAHVDYSVGASTCPIAVAGADLDGDGHIDLATANLCNNSASVLLGKGDGTFGKAAAYPTGTSPVSIAIADFNGDNHQDLAVVNEGGGTVSFLLGKGNGTFKTHVDSSGGSEPQGIAVADFNGDGRLDVSVVDVFSNLAGVLLQGK